MRRHPSHLVLLLAVTALVSACSGMGGSNDVAGPENTVKVLFDGTGTGQVSINSGYLICTAACGPYDWSPGLQVNMVATADIDSTFVKWSGNCTGSDPSACSFVVNGHMAVTATFNKN